MPLDSRLQHGSSNLDASSTEAPMAAQQALDQPTSSQASSTGELNFEMASGLEAKPEEVLKQDQVHASTASGLSVVISALVLLVSIAIAQRLARAKISSPGSPNLAANLSPSWHALSFIISTFLGLNVFFGGMTVFLLTGEPEDANIYFQEISALKLARLSHEHFFGYGILFGTIAALAMFFVSSTRKRILIPITLSFAFSALDASSWWLSRYVSTGFHTLTIITGCMFAFTFLTLYAQLAFVNLNKIFRN